jgi:TonB-like protein
MKGLTSTAVVSIALLVARFTILATTSVSSPVSRRMSFYAGTDEPDARIHAEISRTAALTAQKIAAAGPQRILIASLFGCLAAPQICAEIEAALRDALERSMPGVQFVPREEAEKYLAAHSFLSIDGYFGALDIVASDSGADVVVSEDLEPIAHDKCQLHVGVVETKRRYELADFSNDIPCSIILAKTRMSLIKDEKTGIAMIVRVPQLPDDPRGASPVKFPSCIHCPMPHYSDYARSRNIQGSVRILATVSEDGEVENPVVLGYVDDSLARVSYQALKEWRFSPGLDFDGKPVSTRVLVFTSFRLK